MTKNVTIENVIRQMSGATNTHNVYNSYVHTPQQETAASADVGMDDRLDSEGQDMEDTLQAHRERKRLKHDEMHNLFVGVLKLQHNKHKQRKQQMRICKLVIDPQIHHLQT